LQKNGISSIRFRFGNRTNTNNKMKKRRIIKENIKRIPAELRLNNAQAIRALRPLFPSDKRW